MLDALDERLQLIVGHQDPSCKRLRGEHPSISGQRQARKKSDLFSEIFR
jgi:hypothetical protein